jgi:DNA-binding MarR family transcriptional regulator
MKITNRSGFIASLGAWNEAVMQESMRAFIAYAREHGLSLSQMGALDYVRRNGECGMADIVEHLGISNAATSQLMDRLVRHGLVERTEDPEDRRAKRVALTREGERLLRGSVAARERWFGPLADALSEDERERSIAALELLTHRTRALREASR